MFESNEKTDALYKQQKSMAETNIAKARRLTEQLRELEEQRKSVQELLTTAREKEKQWQEIEGEMYRAIQPWSLPALQSKLARITAESESLSETLAGSFLDARGGAADADEVAEFVREYCKTRKTFHMRREWLARWNEERVRHA